MSQISLLNFLAWLLAVIGCIGFLAAGVAIVYVALMPSQGPSGEIAASLHDTYYIVHRSKMIIFPLLLCMALCAAVALIGYTLTTQYVISTLQHSTSSNPKT